MGWAKGLFPLLTGTGEASAGVLGILHKSEAYLCFQTLKIFTTVFISLGFPTRWNAKDKSNSKAWTILFLPTFYY